MELRRSLIIALVLTGCSDKPTDDVPVIPTKLEITTTSLAEGEVGVAYSAMIAATGGSGVGYSWSIASGSMAPGLTLRSDGTPGTSIDGTPLEMGTYDFTVKVEDDDGATAEGAFRLVVTGVVEVELAIAPLELPSAGVGVPFSAAVNASGGSGAGYMWTVSQGDLPDGLAIAPAGTPQTTISGTPTLAGTFSFELTVTDDEDHSDSQSFTLEIAGALKIETTLLPGGRQGANYTGDISATGGVGGYSWSIVQGSLPPGLTLAPAGSPSTAISGSPTDWGTYNFTVRVEDAGGSFDEESFEIQLLPLQIQIVTSTVPDPIIERPYSAVIEAANGSGMGYSWLISSGTLPQGITLARFGTPTTTISGTPVAFGTHTATITVTDSTTGDSDSRVLTMRIALPPIFIDTTMIADPVYGSLYTATITGSGGYGTLYIWTVVQGSLPPGLSLTQIGFRSTTLSGIPTVSGPFDFTVELRDGYGTATTQRLVGTVTGGDLAILTRTLPTADAGASYSFTLRPAGGSGGYIWAISSGALPAGLSLSAGGTLSGTTNAFGLHRFEVSLTDSSGSSVSARLLLQVSAPQTSALIVGDLITDDDVEVFINDITGGSSPIRISPAGAGTFDASTEPGSAQFSPDNRRAAFVGDFTTDGLNSLYVVDLLPTVGVPIEVSGTANVITFAWAPDSEQLVVRVGGGPSGRELYWVDMRGGVIGPPQRINGQGGAGGTLTPFDCYFSPDAEKIVFSDSFFGQRELFLVEVSGSMPSTPIRINANLQGQHEADGRVLFLPDGNSLVYAAQEAINNFYHLVWADITGASVNARVTLSEFVVLDRVAISPDGGRLLFIEGAFPFVLYLADFTAGSLTPQRVSPDVGRSFTVHSAKWSPDGRRILYVADQDAAGYAELYAVDVPTLAVGPPVRVNPSLPFPDSAVPFDSRDVYAWSPDSSRVAFLLDDVIDDAFDLWTADVTVNPPVASRVSPAMPTSGDVLDFVFSPNSDQIVYRADAAVDAQDDLFVSSLTGATPTPPQRVTPLLPSGGDVVSGLTELRWSRDSQTIYYRADQVTDEVFQAYGVSVAGGAPGAPFLIHGALPGLDADALLLDVQP